MGIDALFGLRNLGIGGIFGIFIRLGDYSFLGLVFLRIDGRSSSNLSILIFRILRLFYRKDLLTLHPKNIAGQYDPIHHYNVLNNSFLELNFQPDPMPHKGLRRCIHTIQTQPKLQRIYYLLQKQLQQFYYKLPLQHEYQEYLKITIYSWNKILKINNLYLISYFQKLHRNLSHHIFCN